MGNNINFSKAYERQHKSGGSGSSLSSKQLKTILIVAVSIYCALVASLTAFWRYEQYQNEQESQTINEYLNSSKSKTELTRLQGIQQQYAAVKAENDKMAGMQGVITSHPSFSLDALYQLTGHQLDGMTLMTMSYADPDGTLTTLYNCTNSTTAYQFVTAVKNAGYFDNVWYNGWSSGTTYTFIIYCTMRGNS